MATAYNMVIGISLVVLLALLVGMCLAGVWRHLTRQLTRSGLVVFLIGAGIATVEAQKLKTGYVDASVAVSGDGSSWEKAAKSLMDMSGRMGYGGTLYVKPGVYRDGFSFPARYGEPHQRFSVIAVEGPDKTVIDGGYVTYYSEVLTLQWTCLCIEGFTFRNLEIPLSQAEIHRCRFTGFSDTMAWDSYLLDCLIDHNDGSEYSWGLIDDSTLLNCTVVANSAFGSFFTYSTAYNSIFRHNELPGLFTGDVQEDPYTLCCINCTTNDPGFVDETKGDYHIRMGSPCINIADHSTWISDYDYDGNPRVQRGRADLGCYEYQPTNDHQTITAPVPVEFAWVDEKCPKLLAECGGDYDKAVLMKAANPVDISLPEPLRTYYSIWESYVADLDPTDSNQTFRATIEMVDGEPVVKGDPESPRRKYTVLGKEKLSDEKWQENLPGAQFFKVKVGLR